MIPFSYENMFYEDRPVPLAYYLGTTLQGWKYDESKEEEE